MHCKALISAAVGSLVGVLLANFAMFGFGNLLDEIRAKRSMREFEESMRGACSKDPGPGYDLKLYHVGGGSACLAPAGEWAKQLEASGVVGERLYTRGGR